MVFVHAMRVTALVVVGLASAQALFVVSWYIRYALVPPRRVWHVLSVGIGLLLAYKQMLFETTYLLIAHAAFTWASPTLISSALFIMTGVHFLYADARERVRRRRGGHR